MGIASPHFRTGKRSKYLAHLPDTLAPHFQPEDPDRVGLRDELALADTRIIDLLEQLKAGHANPPWHDVQHAVAQFRRARASRNAASVIRAIDQLDALLTGAANGAHEWDQLMGLMELRYKLVAVESRRQKG